MFDAPIAGQSLTKKIGSRPYENPPEIGKVEDVLALYLDTLAQEDTKDEISTMMQQGLPIKAIVQGMIKKNVMDGIHTLDVGYIIEPLIIEIIKQEADAMGVDYIVSYQDLVKGREIKRQNHDRRVNEITQAQMEGNSPVDIKRMAGIPTLRDDQEESEEPMMPTPTEEETPMEKPMRKGLMARGT